MATRKLYHGTSEANAVKILLHGFDPHAEPNWLCSRPETYFWDSVKVLECEALDSIEGASWKRSP